MQKPAQRMGKTEAPPRDVDAYLAAVPAPARGALEKLRRAIAAAVPEATEVISYRMPAFKYQGSTLVYFAAFKDHCSLYPGASVIDAHKKELARYDTSPGTIRFPPDKPLPQALVKKLVKARVKENEALAEARSRRKARR